MPFHLESSHSSSQTAFKSSPMAQPPQIIPVSMASYRICGRVRRPISFGKAVMAASCIQNQTMQNMVGRQSVQSVHLIRLWAMISCVMAMAKGSLRIQALVILILPPQLAAITKISVPGKMQMQWTTQTGQLCLANTFCKSYDGHLWGQTLTGQLERIYTTSHIDLWLSSWLIWPFSTQKTLKKLVRTLLRSWLSCLHMAIAELTRLSSHSKASWMQLIIWERSARLLQM